MIKYYLISAFRNIKKNYYFTFINLIGQSIGLAGFLLIMYYVTYQYSYDTFFSGYRNIYRVTHETRDESGAVNKAAITFSRVAYELKQSFISIEEAVRIHKLFSVVKVSRGEKLFFENKVISVDSNFFSVFNFPMKYGDVDALHKANSIVITDEMALKYFGNENPLGKELLMEGGYGFWGSNGLDDKVTYVVTGVLQPLPLNTHLDFDFLISLSLFSNLEGELNNWGDDIYTYLKLKDLSQFEAINNALPQISEKYKPKKGVVLGLQPLEDIHLNSHLLNEMKTNGDSFSVMLLAGVAFLIVLIASANYINFATANAINKQREIAIRKVYWAKRSNLVSQVLVETLIINLISLLLGLILIVSGATYFKSLLGVDVLKMLAQPTIWLFIVILLSLVTLLSGLYPAYVIARIGIHKIRNEVKSGSNNLTQRSVLVALQFTISMIVIGGTIVLYEQLKFMRKGEVGIAINNTLVINGPMVEYEDDSVYQSLLSAFKIEAANVPGVSGVSSANFLPGKEIKGKAVGYVRKVEEDSTKAKIYYFSQVDYPFIKNFQMKLLAGRSFDERFPSDQESIIINKAACDLLNFSSPEAAIGNKIIYRMQSRPTIIGVIDNFHQESFKRDFQPTIFELTSQADAYYFVNLQGSQNLDQLEGIWKKIFPESPFSYFYLSDFYSGQYAEDNSFANAVSTFAVVGIFISTIGLLGLIYFIALSKVKEIGIRKSLGAEFIDVFLLLSKGIGLITIISSLVAIPLIFVLSKTWLEGYAFRIDIAWWMLLLPVAVLTVVAASVIGIQTIIANRNNPVLALREQ